MAVSWRNQYTRYREFYLNIVNLYKQKADLRAFLEIILSLSTIILFSVFALKPTALTIIALVKEINEKKLTVTNLTKKVNDLEQAGEVYVANQNLIPMINTAISTLPTPETFSMQVLALGQSKSVEIMGLSVGQIVLVGEPPSKKGKSEFKPLPENANEMPFSVSVKGSYPNLINFISVFESMRIPVKIDLVGINSSTQVSERIIVAVISGRVPFLQNKQSK